jgi:putative protease
MKNKLELLAPVGDFTNLRIAIDAGADAIYFGLKEFSLRSNAKNFKIEDLDKINEMCAEKNLKKYLTLNSIIYNEELLRVDEILQKAKGKIDAVICWDLGVIQLCIKNKIPFHVSTQASVSNYESAEFYKKLGAERIVFARELNLEQIKEIIQKTGIEGEAFIHGAMCVAVSGRCFMSQFLFNRSANRGQCIHPCRREYIIKDTQQGKELKIENNHVMSAKDLCALPFIDKLKSSGITSFKIEGRNRDPRYVETVVRIYRKALDSEKPLTEEQINKFLEELKSVYNKGFSSGFYLGSPTADDFSKTEHSDATKKKHFIGTIQKYYPKLNVATVKLVSELKINDEINIIGKTTGLVKTKIGSMEIKNQPIEKASKGEEMGIKVPNKVRKDDDVYLILKNN